jgi:predicted NBD/HSP70 family sugar kinase
MKSIEELEREADRRKAELDAKVDRIRERLMPQNIAEEALRSFATPANAATDAVLETAKRSPLLVLTLAAGAGWLLLNARKNPVRKPRRARSNRKRVKELTYVSTRR